MTLKPPAFILIAPAFLVKQEKQKKTKKKDDNTFDGEEGEKVTKEGDEKEKQRRRRKSFLQTTNSTTRSCSIRLVFLESRVGMRRVFVIQHRSEAFYTSSCEQSFVRNSFGETAYPKVVAKSKASLVDDSLDRRVPLPRCSKTGTSE